MKRILVADDSITIQKVIALTFADEPCEVRSVGTGAEALELIKTWKPDILLADVIMPQMNGYELCRAVKEQPETASIPVLLLAGTFEAFDGEEAKSVGADDYITKPFESGEMIEKVNALTGGAPPAPPAREAREEPVPASASSPVPEPVPDSATEPPPQAPAPTVLEPQGATASAASQEPDIWDILSDGDDMFQGSAADEGAPGLGSLEDQAVVDVGSFDVGLDRPEPAAPPPKPRPETGTEPQHSGGDEPPPVPPQPSPMPEPIVPPVELVTASETVIPPVVESTGVTLGTSRIEGKEKDFFGFESEGFETAAAEDLLGDAVEEITFDVEKPAPDAGETGLEASFVVPEPSVGIPPEMGETVSPETLAFEIPESVVPEPVAGFVPEVPEAPAAVVPKLSLPSEPASPDEEVFQGAVPEPFSPGSPEPPVAEPRTEVPEPEIIPAPEPPLELEMGQKPLRAPADASALEEAEVRKIIEEKVEKIVWEVVPELAEILIRETIEKIKGGS